MNNKISIIIPVYNVEKYLHQCIDSVINQTLKDIEIICVNDGSTDNSLNILNEYAKNDTRIRIINKKNSGYGDSMNKGIDVATGEYIGFVESDDFASLNMFEELYNLAKEFDAEVVRSNWYRYKEDSSNKESTNLYIDIPKNCIINPIEYKDLYIVHTLIASAIYSRKYLNEFNIRFLPTPGASYQDTSFEAKTIMTANRIIVTNESFYNYRIDNPNSSVKQTGKVFCICDEYKAINEYMEKYPNARFAFEQHKCANQFREYIWNLNRLTKSESLKFLKQFQKEFQEYYSKNILGEEFQKRYPIKDIELLINNPKVFYRKYVVSQHKLSILQHIFSIRNENNHKVLTILGIKIKFKRNKK